MENSRAPLKKFRTGLSQGYENIDSDEDWGTEPKRRAFGSGSSQPSDHRNYQAPEHSRSYGGRDGKQAWQPADRRQRQVQDREGSSWNRWGSPSPSDGVGRHRSRSSTRRHGAGSSSRGRRATPSPPSGPGRTSSRHESMRRTEAAERRIPFHSHSRAERSRSWSRLKKTRSADTTADEEKADKKEGKAEKERERFNEKKEKEEALERKEKEEALEKQFLAMREREIAIVKKEREIARANKEKEEALERKFLAMREREIAIVKKEREIARARKEQEEARDLAFETYWKESERYSKFEEDYERKLEKFFKKWESYNQATFQNHPSYATEWSLWYKMKYAEVKAQGKDPDPKTYPYKEEWIFYWINTRIQEVKDEEFNSMRRTVLNAYGYERMPDPPVPPASLSLEPVTSDESDDDLGRSSRAVCRGEVTQDRVFRVTTADLAQHKGDRITMPPVPEKRATVTPNRVLPSEATSGVVTELSFGKNPEPFVNQQTFAQKLLTSLTLAACFRDHLEKYAPVLELAYDAAVEAEAVDGDEGCLRVAWTAETRKYLMYSQARLLGRVETGRVSEERMQQALLAVDHMEHVIFEGKSVPISVGGTRDPEEEVRGSGDGTGVVLGVDGNETAQNIINMPESEVTFAAGRVLTEKKARTHGEEGKKALVDSVSRKWRLHSCDGVGASRGSPSWIIQ